MSLLQEFKTFALRGNVVDLAVGVIIGTAFGRIVTSLVNDIVMPPLGLLTGGMEFKDQAWTLKAATPETPSVAIAYGPFLNSVVDFLIVALVIFLVVKQMNRLTARMKPAAAPVPAAPSEKTCEYCQSKISIAATRCPYCTSQLA